MRSHTHVLAAFVVLFALAACSEPEPDAPPEPEPVVVDVTAIYDGAADRHLFQTSADTVPAGWTTFRFTNASPMLHFVLLDHLPGERTSDELLSEVSPIFQESSDLIREGRMEESAAAFARLPEWFGGIVFRGGPGFTSPGLATEATLFLEPGNYVLECYIKTADGVFHWNLGMHADLHVTADTTDAAPPAGPTLTVTVTDTALVMDGMPTAGEHLVEVRFEEQEPALIGRDVHVARMEPGVSIEEVLTWMDFNRPEGLVSTAEDPAPTTFLGGLHDMPLGNTAYFRVTLEPGNYAWVSEQPLDAATYLEFTVP